MLNSSIWPYQVRMDLGKKWQWRSTPDFPKLQSWNLAIRWFNVISRILVRGGSHLSTEMQSEYSTASADWAESRDKEIFKQRNSSKEKCILLRNNLLDRQYKQISRSINMFVDKSSQTLSYLEYLDYCPKLYCYIYTFRQMRLSAFFRNFFSNSGTFTELWTKPFI